MSKKSLARLIRIVTGTFGTGRDEIFSQQSSFTKLEKFTHFWVLVARSFVRNRCPIRASALSYTTLLALIPMLAVAMSVSSIFLKSAGEDQIKNFIGQVVQRLIPEELPMTNAAPVFEWRPAGPETFEEAVASASPGAITNAAVTPEAITNANVILNQRVEAAQDRAANYIYQFIQNTYSGTLGATGVVFLFWTAIVMLIRVEETFNDIWGVARGREWSTRVANYLTALVVGPLLLIAAFGLATGPRFQKTREWLGLVPFLEPILSQLLPVAVVSFAFAMFYKLMPNTKVNFSAAFVGGALAGTGWHVFNLISLHLASRAVGASKIYGSLALLPLLMLGLYIVWIMILFGAQVAYAFQNRESYVQEKLAENVNQRGREFVALRLMTCIGQNFARGLPPATVSQMSRELGIPSKLIQQVLATLLTARLVVEVSGEENGYTPARPLEGINCHHVLLAMRASAGQDLRTRDEPVREEVYGEFARIQAAEKAAASSVSLLALVHRAQSRMEISAPGLIGQPTEEAMLEKPVTDLPFEPKPNPDPEDSEKPTQPTPVEPAKVQFAPEAGAASKLDSDEAMKQSEKQSSTDEDERGFPL